MTAENSSVAYPKKLLFILAAIIGLMVFCAYSNTFEARPVLDDLHTFVEEPLVRIQEFNRDSIFSLGNTKFGWSRWIPMATLAFDLWIGKGKELLFLHLTNLIIHLLCFLSVAFLVAMLFRASNRSASPGNDSPAAFLSLCVAGLWALHPLQTNAVTYIVQRMASLAALFTLLSIAFYIFGRIISTTPNHSRIKALLCYFCSLVSMIMAFFSKENSAIIPILLVATEVWFFRPDLFKPIFSFCRRRWKLSLPVGVIMGFAAVYLLSSYIIPGYGNRHFTLIQRMMTEPRVIIFYISLLLWPASSRLSLEHDVVVSTSLIHPPTTALSIIALSFLTWFAVSRRKHHPLITYGIVWFMLNLLIESSIIPLELIFEHRMYLSSIGLILSLVVAIHAYLQKRVSRISPRDFGTLTWCCFAILASVFCLTTFYRNATWQDPLALARDCAQKAPNNPRAHANLAAALVKKGDYEEGILEAEKAMSLGIEHFEQNAVALNALITAYSHLGQHQKAIEVAGDFLAKNVKKLNAMALPTVYMNLAQAEEHLGNLKGAYENALKGLSVYFHIPNMSSDIKGITIAYLDTLISRAHAEDIDLNGDRLPGPGEISSKARVARLLLGFGDRSGAKKILQQAGFQDGNDVSSKVLLEAMLNEERLNEIQQTKRDFSEKYVLNPFSRFNASMAVAFVIQKQKFLKPFSSMGEAFLDDALQLKPDSADAHLLKGYYYYNRDQAEEAVEKAKQAVILDPDYAKAWLGLGFFLAKANRPQEAIGAFNRTLELYPGYPQRLAIVDIISNLRDSMQSLVKNDDVKTN